MKWQAVIVLLAIAISVLVPPSLSLTVAHNVRAEIGALDVCHSTTPALSSNGEMPCVTECSCHPLYVTLNTIVEPMSSSFKPLLFALQDERPPKFC